MAVLSCPGSSTAAWHWPCYCKPSLRIRRHQAGVYLDVGACDVVSRAYL